MQSPNTKIYLVVSVILVILFFLVTFYPLSKKPQIPNQKTDNNLVLPTSIESKEADNIPNRIPTVKVADSTGVYEEALPQYTLNLSNQKQDLRQRVPFDTGLFQIDFDYENDKFVVTLSEPKQENRSQFDQWLKSNYPNLSVNQFNFR